MTTLTIHIPDKKTNLVKQLLKELDVKFEVEKANKKSKTPNAETVKAIKDARDGKTKQISDFKAFFESI